MYVAVDNRVYFCEYGDPHNWEALNYIVVPERITGLASSNSGLLIFASGRIDVLLGLDVADYQLRPVSSVVGCESFKTIKTTPGGVIFMGHGSIHIATSNGVKNISEDKLGGGLIDFHYEDITSSVFANDAYIVATEDRFLVMDLVRGIKFYSLTDNSYDGNGYYSINEEKGNVYGHKDGVSYILNANEDELSLLEFKSGDIINGEATNLKEYDKTRIVFEGEFDVRVYLDGTEVITKRIASQTKIMQMLGFSNVKNRGTRLSYIVIGTGTIYAIDFTIRGRSNQP
jgi:ethanolamine utilization protein EutQ (cupin superfamily)